MKQVDTTLACEHEYVMGASGSGKSYYVKRKITGLPRVIVWDPDDEYGDIAGGETVSLAAELVARAHEGNGIIRYVPPALSQKQKELAHNLCCAVAFEWFNCVLVAEEIADVTSPSKAGGDWGVVLRRGRKRGVTVIGVSQRPAEADKTMFTQANVLRCGRLDGEGDIARVAKNMRIPEHYLSQLGALDFFELDRRTGELKAGRGDKFKVVRANWTAPLAL